MALTDAQVRTKFLTLESAIERVLQILNNHTPSMKMLRSLTDIRNQDITDLQTRVVDLESTITLLQAEVANLSGT